MNHRFRSVFIALALCLLLSSCNNASPENYFDEAVLNVNLITPFGGQAALQYLAHPSVKLVPGTKDQTTPMTRREIVDDQIQRVEGNLTKIKALPDSEETRDMVQTSIKLHEFVLPVYKTEYRQLAKLYDESVHNKNDSQKLKRSTPSICPVIKPFFIDWSNWVKLTPRSITSRPNGM